MKPLPITDIGGTPFFVDLLRMEFREVDDPANRISFFELHDKGDHLLLFYDNLARKAWEAPDKDSRTPGNVKMVRLPPLNELDPFAYTLLQGRQDKRLDQLTKAAKLLCSPTRQSNSPRTKLK
jgi:hypothetical protein